MVSCNTIKGAKVSVADSRPFATPSRFLSRQNYRAFLRNVCDSLRLLARRFFANFLFACEAPRWRFSYRLSIRLRRMFLTLLISCIICRSMRPLIILCARTARIQRGHDVHKRWTERSHSWLLSGEFLAPAFRRMLRSPEWCRAERDV